jgi:hypothetical protein
MCTNSVTVAGMAVVDLVSTAMTSIGQQSTAGVASGQSGGTSGR